VLPSAPFCVGADEVRTLAGSWCEAVGVIGLLALLFRLRRIQNTTVRRYDQNAWTAADYAVQVDGLAAGLPPSELEETLRADIATIHVRASVSTLGRGMLCSAWRGAVAQCGCCRVAQAGC
jgi:hypothetical protein